jgi:DNA replication protein DnaC
LEDPELVTRVFMQAPDYRRPTDDTQHSDLSSLAMHHEQTFSNWDDRLGEDLSATERKSLEKALKTATDYSRSPKGWLLFTGTYACGKTHLAAAIANARADLGQPPMLISVSELLDHLRATFSTNSQVSLDRRFEEIRSAPLLILDALGEQSPTPWANEKLFQIIDYRHLNKLPTVMTTAKYLEELDPRILSRILDTRICSICAITAPGYRVEQQSQSLGGKRPGISRDPGSFFPGQPSIHTLGIVVTIQHAEQFFRLVSHDIQGLVFGIHEAFRSRVINSC